MPSLENTSLAKKIKIQYGVRTRIIFTIFAFLRIDNSDLIGWKWIYPSIFSTLIIYFENDISEDAKEIMLRDINSILGILFGFYIATLALISNSTSSYLNQSIKGGRPTMLWYFEGNDWEKREISRKQFLLFLFGYCAVLSITLYILGSTLKMFDVSFGNFFVLTKEKFGLFWLLYIWLMSSLFVVTLLGLYYLIDRMHRQ